MDRLKHSAKGLVSGIESAIGGKQDEPPSDTRTHHPHCTS